MLCDGPELKKGSVQNKRQILLLMTKLLLLPPGRPAVLRMR